MQNFTLGKKGHSMLLFVLVLLIGSSPSYGQTNCPTVTDPSQDFCALATVSDLQATPNGNGLQWFDDQTSTDPIPDNEILEDDKIYFAGNNSNSCTGNRETVTANVSDAGPPVLAPGEDEFFTPCQRTAGNPDNNDIGTLKTGIEFNDVAGFRIEYYTDEFDQNSPILPDNTELIAGTSYFAGLVGNNITDCQTSSRTAIRYEPIVVPAPTAEPVQTVCAGTTVGELEASGTNRWYRTATSEPPLPNSTVLEDGKVYYATQIIPSDGPPCESQERTPVGVIVQPSNNVESTQEFCASVGTGNDFRMPQVRDLSPDGGTFFAEENSTTPLDPDTVLVDGEDYFNRDNGAECSQDRITVNFRDTPNAGSTTQTTTCENETPFNLVDRINDSQLGEPDRDGTFSPPLSTGTQIFNPADYSPGTYTFNYNVSSSSSCPDDTAVISVEVLAAPNAGPGGSFNVCSNDIPTLLADPTQFAGLLPAGITPGGTFSPTLEQLAIQFFANPSAPLTTEYTVTSANGCSASATYTVNVIQGPNAGNDSSVTLSTDQAPVNLFSFINGNPDTEGTFSPGNANGDLDPADYTPGEYTFTYTVTSSNGCSDASDLVVTITDEIICPVVDDTTQEFCESISDADGNNPRRPQVRDLMPMNITWYATANSTEALPSTETLLDNEDYFAGNANGDCPNRERVIVQIDDAPNAGATTNIIACRNEAPFDIVSRLNPSILGAADAGGTVTPALASGTTVFNPAVDPARQYTYTVQSENGGCADDSAFFSVQILDAPNAGPDASIDVCSNDVPTILANPALFAGLLPAGITPGGNFNPTLEQLAAQFIANPSAPLTTEYTVTSANGCSDSATYTAKVSPSPNAGDDSSVTLNTQQDPVNLFSFINGNPETGGNFSPGNANGDLDPADYTLGDYTFTYTVTSSNGCIDSSDLVVTITDEVICPVVDDTTQEFCESISDADGNNPRRPQVRDLMPINTIWYDTDTSTEALSPNETLRDNEDYFAGNANGDCPNRERVNVQIGIAPNAGATTNITACSTETPFDIVSRLNPSILGDADAGGTITPAFASGTTVFNPAVDAGRQYRYTVLSEFGKCEDDFTIINITITEPVPANAGPDVSLTVCSTDGTQDLFQSLSEENRGGSFAGLTNGIFDPATAIIGNNTVVYTLDSDDGCFSGSDSANIIINVIQGPNAGDDSNVTLSTQQNPVNLFDFINGNPDTGGTFSPDNLNGDLDPANFTEGDYTFTYSVSSSNGCIDSSLIIVTITTDIITCPIVEDVAQEFCESISDADGNNPRRPQIRDLMPLNTVWYATATSTDALAQTQVLEDNEDYFAGNSDGTCPNRERVVIQIGETPNAGATTNITACTTDDSFDIVSRLNPSILGAADAGGTITPAFASGTTVFNPAVDTAGQYRYTVTSEFGKCVDDFTFINITINEASPAIVGNIPNQETCVVGNTISLATLLNGDTTSLGGTFSGTGVANGIFDPAEAGEGLFTITYDVNGDNISCTDGNASGTFTINVTLEATEAEVGTIPNQVSCIDGDTIALTTLLNADDTTLGGTFTGTGVTNGIFDPATAGVGTFTITYDVNGENNPCIDGSASGTFTINVTDLDAPIAVANQSFCLIDNPTVGDIVVTGENVVIYSDADLTDEVDATTSLTSETSYYAVSTNDTGSCASDATVITVTITDSSAPTLTMDGDEFCRSDNPTIQDLVNNFSGSGIVIYSSSTGGSAISATTLLQNGVTYYGASLDVTTGCESSERIAVVAKVEFCGIPEGFSPNGDGKNDQFVIPDIATIYPNYTIEVFNRWGNVVFKGNASTGDWDGISNQSGTLGDDVLPVGVYFYILNYNDGQTSPVQGKLYLSI